MAARRGDHEGATLEAERALREADRAGLPTAWSAHAALADAQRGAGDEERAAEHVRQAETLVAALIETIDDGAIRAAFAERAAERLSAGGRGG